VAKNLGKALLSTIIKSDMTLDWKTFLPGKILYWLVSISIMIYS